VKRVREGRGEGRPSFYREMGSWSDGWVRLGYLPRRLLPTDPLDFSAFTAMLAFLLAAFFFEVPRGFSSCVAPEQERPEVSTRVTLYKLRRTCTYLEQVWPAAEEVRVREACDGVEKLCQRRDK
jgi:hypothetical protein